MMLIESDKSTIDGNGRGNDSGKQKLSHLLHKVYSVQSYLLSIELLGQHESDENDYPTFVANLERNYFL